MRYEYANNCFNMTKYISTLLAAFVSLVPAISLAQGVGQINGNGNANQTLATTTGTTTMHMQITTDQGTHTFQWDNTPWRVDQGGTGQTSFTPGALIYGNGTAPFAMTAAGNLGDILQFNGTIPTWVSPSSIFGLLAADQTWTGNNTFAGQVNLPSTVPNVTGNAFGDLLYWTGSAWASVATSSLGITGNNGSTFDSPHGH